MSFLLALLALEWRPLNVITEGKLQENQKQFEIWSML